MDLNTIVGLFLNPVMLFIELICSIDSLYRIVYALAQTIPSFFGASYARKMWLQGPASLLGLD